jgi:2-C-methyl-D-erythritol 4-phosphate cytidylyltransferase/2-C-methyl-D-erythritol 2,4-cyclodiphosphate synthase
MDMHVAAIVVAAGKGERLAGDRPKQFLDLGHGKTMLDMSIAALQACPSVNEIVVAVPPEYVATLRVPNVRFVAGGARRQDSVASAFEQVSAHAEIVVIHDAARPFVTPDVIQRTIDAARKHGAAIAAAVVIDTVKQVGTATADGSRSVRATLPRETIFLAQTPQTFRREVLAEAMAAASDVTVTDEAMLVERAGFPVHIVESDAMNTKVTTKEDFAQASARVLGTFHQGGSMRIGTGYDLHRLVEGRALILGGVRIPFERGLHGHSDADIVCHAVTDAILGGAGAGDIGRLFPDTDPRWKDADSIDLLRAAMTCVRENGYVVANVDVTVVAERPKLVPYLDEMRANLARALGVDQAAVSIKGKTNEQVGEIGRSEAMACHAVALLQKASR